MADKFIELYNGGFRQKEGLVSSAGAGDAGKIPALDSGGKLDPTLMPTGVGADTRSVPASENLAAGNLVNLWNDGGTLKVRKADATVAGKEADGFVKEAVTSGNNATVYFDGQITGLTGLTIGAKLYLSTTAGQVTGTPPTTATQVVQSVGKATSTTEMVFEPGDPVTLA